VDGYQVNFRLPADTMKGLGHNPVEHSRGCGYAREDHGPVT